MSKKRKRTLKDIIDGFFKDAPKPLRDEAEDDISKLINEDHTIEEGEEDGKKWTKETWKRDDGVFVSKIIISPSEDDIEQFGKDLDEFFDQMEKDFPGIHKTRLGSVNRKRTKEDTKSDTLEILDSRLKVALIEERYEDAAKLRDLIKSYTNGNSNK